MIETLEANFRSHADAMHSAKSLRERYTALRALDAQLVADKRAALDDPSYGVKLEEIVDLADLPTFGGEPVNLNGVYSWGETHMLEYDNGECTTMASGTWNCANEYPH